jgi:hypothetical protein
LKTLILLSSLKIRSILTKIKLEIMYLKGRIRLRDLIAKKAKIVEMIVKINSNRKTESRKANYSRKKEAKRKPWLKKNKDLKENSRKQP